MKLLSKSQIRKIVKKRVEEADERLKTREIQRAAEELGVTERTIRRYIK